MVTLSLPVTRYSSAFSAEWSAFITAPARSPQYKGELSILEGKNAIGHSRQSGILAWQAFVSERLFPSQTGFTGRVRTGAIFVVGNGTETLMFQPCEDNGGSRQEMDGRGYSEGRSWRQ
jgi:hypothetical protein